MLLAVLQGAAAAASRTHLVIPDTGELGQLQLVLSLYSHRISEGRRAPSSPLLALSRESPLEQEAGNSVTTCPWDWAFPWAGLSACFEAEKWKRSFFPPLDSWHLAAKGALGVAATPAGLALRCSVHSFRSMMLFLPYPYFSKWHSWIQVLNSSLVWSNSKGHWKRKTI